MSCPGYQPRFVSSARLRTEPKTLDRKASLEECGGKASSMPCGFAPSEVESPCPTHPDVQVLFPCVSERSMDLKRDSGSFEGGFAGADLGHRDIDRTGGDVMGNGVCGTFYVTPCILESNLEIGQVMFDRLETSDRDTKLFTLARVVN